MMNIKKLSGIIISYLIILTALMPLCTYAVESSSRNFENCGVYDTSGTLSESEVSQLSGTVRETAKQIDMYVAVFISGEDMSDYETEVFSEECYEDMFGENTDGIFFYMDLSDGKPLYDYISTSGMGALIYTDYRNDGKNNVIDKIFKKVYNYLPSSESGQKASADDLKLAVEEFCSQLKIYADNEVKTFYYNYDPVDKKYIYESGGKAVVSSHKPYFVMIKYLPIGLLIGIVTAIVMFFIIKSTYKFRKSCDSSVYISKDETNFTVKDDRFIRQYVTKKKIERSSSSGGSHRSGGGSHGGGSHGGGGSHR